MEANKKCVRKSFLPHQNDGEELFLEKMHRDGWRFVKLYKGIPTKYEFEKCEPEEYVYQLDYIKTDEDTEVYHQLFLDAGWKEILEWNGVGGKWYYFIKKKEGQVRERIFTDVQSKIELINKVKVDDFVNVEGICIGTVKQANPTVISIQIKDPKINQ